MLSPTASLVLVVIGVAGTLIPALVASWLAAHHIGVLLQLRSAARVCRLDRPGSVVLSGQVVADGDDMEPVKITIQQERVASERSPVVLWREVSRTPTLRPFTIALANGAHVRVEPDPDTRIADELSLEVEPDVEPDWGPLASGTRGAGDRRVRSASIRAGDAIQLVGALRASTRQRPKSSAFRGAVAQRGADDTPPPRALVLRRHPLEPLLLSKRGLSRDRVPRVLLHASAVALFAALGLILHLGVLTAYYGLALWGEPAWASVVGVITPAGDVAEVPTAGDRLRLALDVGHARFVVASEVIDESLAVQVAEARHEQRALSIGTLVLSSPTEKPIVVLGTRPRAPLAAIPLIALALLFSAGYLLAARRARPWFERASLNEREPQLEGTLLAKRS